VTTMPGLALRAHRAEGIVASELPGSRRHIYAATYGEPPDPPAIAAQLSALAEAATSTDAVGGPSSVSTTSSTG
jgi:hypothetical protein